MSKSYYNVKEIKALFKNKLKDRKRIKGISFSYSKNEDINNLKRIKPNISVNQKIKDNAISNSFINYSSLKSYIYSKEQKDKNFEKKDKLENVNIKNLKLDLNYTNIYQLFNLVFNKYNPFNYNINKKKLEVKKIGILLNKNKVKSDLLKKILPGKKITSRIDSGIKKDIKFDKIYQQIQNYKNILEKKKSLLNQKKICIKSYTTKNNIKLNKSSSYVINKSNLNKYLSDMSNTYIINDKQNNNEISKSIEQSNQSINNTERKLFKSASEAIILTPKNKSNIIKINNSNLRKRRKSCIESNNLKIIIRTNKKSFKQKYKNLNKSHSTNLLYIHKNRNMTNNKNKNSNIYKMNKEKINKNINNYVSNIEDMFEEYNKIKSNTNRLKLEYKMWHFSKYSNIDEIINAKEDMLLFLLKQKFFKNQKNYPRLKMESSLKKKSVNNIIREYFNNVEDDEYKFGKKINFYKY